MQSLILTPLILPLTSRSRFSSSISSPHIILSISPEWALARRDGSKTCEFRKYMSSPRHSFCLALRNRPRFRHLYCYRLDFLRFPGQVLGPGVNNDNFNAGRLSSRFAYPILSTHRLPRLVSFPNLLLTSQLLFHRWCPAPSSLSCAFPGFLPV